MKRIRKLLPLLVVSILVFGGLGTVAIPIEKPTEAQPLNIQDSPVEIKVKGGLLGYKVTVTNIGNETLENININMTITTKAWIMLTGDELKYDIEVDDLHSEESITNETTPDGIVLGFGPATINMDGEIACYDLGDKLWSINGTGFVFLFYVSFEERFDPYKS